MKSLNLMTLRARAGSNCNDTGHGYRLVGQQTHGLRDGCTAKRQNAPGD